MRSFPWQNESAQRTVHGNEAAIKTPTPASTPTLSSARTWLSDQLAATTQHTLTHTLLHTQCRTHAHHLNFTSRRATKYSTAASSVLAESTENEQGKGQGEGEGEGGREKNQQIKEKNAYKKRQTRNSYKHPKWMEKNQNIFIIFCGNLRIHLNEKKHTKR